MTNTTQPMTFEEWLKNTLFTAELKTNEQWMELAWNASQAQQASVIERLKRVIQSYEGEVSVNEKTIAELVEALEKIASRTQDYNLTWWQILAREAIAKVKGK